MSSRYLLLVLGFCLAFAATGLAQDAPTAASFDSGMRSIAKLMKRSKWKKASASLKELLREHEQCSWVRGRRAEVEDLTRSCAYRQAHPAPTANDVTSGDMKSFNAKTGKFKIVYRDGEIADFEKGSGLRYHPAKFKGPHTITVKGKSYPRTGGAVLTCLAGNEDPYYSINCGDSGKGTTGYYRASLRKIQKYEDPVQVDLKETSPARVGKSFKIIVKVSSKSISVSYNGRTLLRGAKARKAWGFIAIDNLFLKDEITLEGLADLEWIKSRQDLSEQEALRIFNKNFKAQQYLPKWLYQKLEQPAAAKGGKKAVSKAFPGKWARHFHVIRDQLEDFYRQGKISEGEKFLNNLKPRQFSSIGITWYRGLYRLHGGDRAAALPLFAKVARGDAQFKVAAVLEAEILGTLRQITESRAAFDKLIAKYPTDTDLRFKFARMYLENSDLKNANKVIQEALAAGYESKRLNQLARQLNQTAKGPDWRKRYEIKTRHYIVYSNIDRATCKEAADVLEKGYRAYQTYLPTKATEIGKQFPVFLFAGRSSYSKYASEVMGTDGVGTAGLFSSGIKQLLIWNTPNREQMMRTVRHEGLHQYFDRVMPDPPRWFNEGHAEYFEAARSKTSWKLGVPRDDHVKTLRKTSLMPLKKFRTQDGTTFMRTATFSYAYSWLIVHFLHQGGVANKKVLRALFEGYTKGESTEATWTKAFEGVDVADFERRLKAHLKAF